jgi:hypothetical protein
VSSHARAFFIVSQFLMPKIVTALGMPCSRLSLSQAPYAARKWRAQYWNAARIR